MTSTDPVQQVVNGLVVEVVTHLTADPRRGHPPLLTKHPESLRDGVLRPPDRLRQLADADARNPVQAQQDLQPVGVRQQIETLRPAADVHIRERSRHLVDPITGLRHRPKSNSPNRSDRCRYSDVTPYSGVT